MFRFATRSPRVKTNIQFNGQRKEILPDTTVAGLLAQLEMRPAFVAVEINQELVPRGRHAEHLLHEGDRVEVVTLVGGG